MTQPALWTDEDGLRFPAPRCLVCRNGYHGACDSTAWAGETDYYFPAHCACWADNHDEGGPA